MTTVTCERKAALQQWVDGIIKAIAQQENALEFDLETAGIFGLMMMGEEEMQKHFEAGTDPAMGHEPFLVQILLKRLDLWNVPRTRAAEVMCSLGLNSPGQAVMMAAILKRLYEVQSPKPEKMTAAHIELLLQGGTLSEKFMGEWWDKQKGEACHLGKVDNLLDVVIGSDFQN